MTANEVVGKLAKRLATVSDVWFEVTSAANLDLDRDVPVQGQRHLIASWAGVAAGVRFATKELQDKIVELTIERDEFRDKLQAFQQEVHRLENEDRKHRVNEVLDENRAAIGDAICAKVIEEVAA